MILALYQGTVRSQLYRIAVTTNENPYFYFDAASLSHYHRRDIAFNDLSNEYTFILYFA